MKPIFLLFTTFCTNLATAEQEPREPEIIVCPEIQSHPQPVLDHTELFKCTRKCGEVFEQSVRSVGVPVRGPGQYLKEERMKIDPFWNIYHECSLKCLQEFNTRPRP